MGEREIDRSPRRVGPGTKGASIPMLYLHRFILIEADTHTTPAFV
jgi:hypothetical protein